MLDVDIDWKVIVVGVAGVFVALALAAVFLLGLGNGLHMPELSAWGSVILLVLPVLAIFVVVVWAAAYLRNN